MSTPTKPMTAAFAASRRHRAFKFLEVCKDALASAAADIAEVETFNRTTSTNDPVAPVLRDARDFATSAQINITKLEKRLQAVDTSMAAEREAQQVRAKNAQALAGQHSIARTYDL